MHEHEIRQSDVEIEESRGCLMYLIEVFNLSYKIVKVNPFKLAALQECAAITERFQAHIGLAIRLMEAGDPTAGTKPS